MNQLFLLTRTQGDALAALPTVRAAVKELDPDLPAYAIQTLEDRLAAAVALSRMLQSFLFNVSGTDAMTLIGSVVALALAAMIAGILPASRAARLDPVAALRQE